MLLSDATVETSLIGHQGRCFDLRINPFDPNQVLSGSEDGVAKLWDIEKRRCLHTLTHNKEAEVLRAAFLSRNTYCTAGSDGKVYLWDTQSGAVQRTGELDHGAESSQVYVCEPRDEALGGERSEACKHLLTAAESDVLLWDLAAQRQLSSWRYESVSNEEQGFGGDHRNPTRAVYVFDAKWSPKSGNEVAVALSDGTIRLLDTRQRDGSALTISLEMEELKAAGIKLGHATSVNWNSDASICSVSFGSGIVALLDLREAECLTLMRAHDAPCYGTIFQPDTLNTCLSWSADSTISLWSYCPCDNGPDITTHEIQRVKDFSLLSCCFQPESNRILCGGGMKSVGGRDSKHAFLGTPIYVLSSLSKKL